MKSLLKGLIVQRFALAIRAPAFGWPALFLATLASDSFCHGKGNKLQEVRPTFHEVTATFKAM